MEKEFLEILNEIVAESEKLKGWAVSIIAGTVVAILSSSYLRPLNKRIRLIYLLFLPAWIFLGISFYYGDRISRDRLAAIQIHANKILKNIKIDIDDSYLCQLDYFQYGLIMISVWLILFLFWWIFGNYESKTKIL